MKKAQVNKELFGYIEPGKCWHFVGNYSNASIHNNKVRCQKCNELVQIISGIDFNPRNPDYFSKAGFWDVWEWAQKQDWWKDFINNLTIIHLSTFINSINYKKFPRQVYEFLKERQ